MKVAMETITIYWKSLIYIPKDILYKIMRNIFSFLWIGRHENEKMTLVRWERLAKTKKEGSGASRTSFISPRFLLPKVYGR
jgi:hypothetical protein